MNYSELLKANPHLSKELANNVASLMTIFDGFLGQAFNNSINREDINQKLLTFDFKAMPKYEKQGTVKKSRENTILTNKEEVKKGDEDDAKNILVQALLLHLFPNNSKGLEALYMGVTEAVANVMVGKRNDSEAYVVANLISEVIEQNPQNTGILYSAYFKGDMNSVIGILNEFMKIEEINLLIELLNYDYSIETEINFPKIAEILINVKFRSLKSAVSLEGSYFEALSQKCPDAFDYYISQAEAYNRSKLSQGIKP